MESPTLRYISRLFVFSAVVLGCVQALSSADVDKLSRNFKNLCSQELNDVKLNAMLSNTSVNYTTLSVDGDVELKKLVNLVHAKLLTVTNTVDMNKVVMELAYNMPGGAKTYPQTNECCASQSANSSWKPVDMTQFCTSHYSSSSSNKLMPIPTLNQFKKNMNTNAGIVRQYAGDLKGTYYQYPSGGPQACQYKKKKDNDFRYHNWFVNIASHKKKNVVIVIDQSGSMTSPYFVGKTITTMMKVAKEAAETVMDTFSASDYVGVVAFSDIAHGPPGCFGDRVAQANSRNKKSFKNFIGNLSSIKGTMYSEGLGLAFNMLSKVKSSEPEQFDGSLDVIIFLTDGGPTDNIADIRRVIAEGNRNMSESVRIFFYGFGEIVGKKYSAQSTDMADLMAFADQNNNQISKTYYDRFIPATVTATASPWTGYVGPVGPPGYFTIVDSHNTASLRELMGGYYRVYAPTPPKKPSFQLPVVDTEHGLVVTVATPLVDSSGKLFGVTGSDVKFESLFGDVSRYRLGAYSYAFLVTREGKVLTHRNFAKPSKAQPDIDFISLDMAEPTLDNATTDKITALNETGSLRGQVDLAMSRGISQQDGSYMLKLNATYHYMPVRGFEDQYSIVLVLVDEDKLLLKTKFLNAHQSATRGKSATYHRLDLKQQTTSATQASAAVCVTPQSAVKATNAAASTIKLSPNAFKDPSKYLTQNETTKDVSLIDDILTGVTKNTVLRANALEEIRYTQTFDSLPSSKVAITRYLATLSGVFRIVPGMVLGRGYDPTDEPWYIQSTLFQDKCVFTRPGYSPTADDSLLTISRSLHTSKSAMIGAVAADIPFKFLKLMTDSVIPECVSPDTNCYIMDHSGYLITEAVKSAGSVSGIDHTHITELEPEIIYDISNRSSIMQSMWCRRVGGRKESQMFWHIYPTYTPFSSSSFSCLNYTLHAIAGTNLHCLAVSTVTTCSSLYASYNITGNVTSQSCSCKPTCAVCAAGVSACQCPCKCIAGVDPCTNKFDKLLPPIACPALWSPTKPPKLYSTNVSLTACPLPCHQRHNVCDCLSGGGGCNWCKTASNATGCLSSCPSPLPPISSAAPPNKCPVPQGKTAVSVLVSKASKSNCAITSQKFCQQHCPAMAVFAASAQSANEDDGRYTKLAAGLGVPLAALGALSLIGLVAFLRKKPPVPLPEPSKIKPVEPFNPNIYRASMGGDLMSSVGQIGAQMDEYNSNGDALYGRRASITSHH